MKRCTECNSDELVDVTKENSKGKKRIRKFKCMDCGATISEIKNDTFFDYGGREEAIQKGLFDEENEED